MHMASKIIVGVIVVVLTHPTRPTIHWSHKNTISCSSLEDEIHCGDSDNYGWECWRAVAPWGQLMGLWGVSAVYCAPPELQKHTDKFCFSTLHWTQNLPSALYYTAFHDSWGELSYMYHFVVLICQHFLFRCPTISWINHRQWVIITHFLKEQNQSSLMSVSHASQVKDRDQGSGSRIGIKDRDQGLGSRIGFKD